MVDRWGNNADTAIIIRSFKVAEKLMSRNMLDSYRREMRELLHQRKRKGTKGGRKKR